MAEGSAIDRVREGMDVRASDGAKLGKIKQVFIGDDATTTFVRGDNETCMEVHHGLLGRDVMYIPCTAVADVSEGHVILKVDAKTAKTTSSWHRKPAWVET